METVRSSAALTNCVGRIHARGPLLAGSRHALRASSGLGPDGGLESVAPRLITALVVRASLLLVAVLALEAGCGGDEDSSVDSGTVSVEFGQESVPAEPDQEPGEFLGDLLGYYFKGQ
jgi:hypothetical protein